MDHHCVKCGEPWNIYGIKHGDMKAWESDLLLKGAGCPCCKGVKSANLTLSQALENITENGDIILESQNKWIKPEPYILFECKHCKKRISIDQDNVFYDGDKKIVPGLEDYPELKNCNGYCVECRKNSSVCSDCGARTYDEEDSIFSQELMKAFCIECYEKYSSCGKCGCLTETTFPHDEYGYVCEDCKPEEATEE